MAKKKIALSDLQAETDGDLQVQDTPEVTHEEPMGDAPYTGATVSDDQPTPESISANNAAEAEALEDSGSNSKDPAAVRKLLARVRQLGRDKGAGGKALVELAHTMVEGAVAKLITPDDAERFYKNFRTTEGKAAALPGTDGQVGEGLPASADVQISKLRAFIKFGNYWVDEAEDVMHRATAIHVGLLAEETRQKAAKSPIERPLKLRSTYAALNAVATGHMKQYADPADPTGKKMLPPHDDVPMGDDEIEALFVGEEAKDKTAVDILLQALAASVKAHKGKAQTDNTVGREPVDSMYLEEAIQNLRETINELDPSGETLQKYDAKNKKKDDAEVVASFKNSLKFRLIPGPNHIN
jgi:hypothetical protein